MDADLKGVLQKPHLRNSEEEGSLGSSVVPVEVGEPGRRLGGVVVVDIGPQPSHLVALRLWTSFLTRMTVT